MPDHPNCTLIKLDCFKPNSSSASLIAASFTFSPLSTQPLAICGFDPPKAISVKSNNSSNPCSWNLFSFLNTLASLEDSLNLIRLTRFKNSVVTIEGVSKDNKWYCSFRKKT